jgi:hypothetical protein
MNSTSRNASSRNSTLGPGTETTADSAEATLRLISRLPAPTGLEDRVMAGLKAAPRTARVLHWPARLYPTGSWMRGAAAAAIVFVVAGGGWGIYTRVQPSQTTKVIVMPRAGAGGGFSNAGAMRTPQTVNGPVVTEPVKDQMGNPQANVLQPVEIRPLKKVPERIVPGPRGRRRTSATNKASIQPAVSAAK